MKTPLNQAQTSVYYACKTTVDGELNYQIPELFALPQTIDLDRLQQAVIDTLRAHPYMCSRIEEDEEGVPVVVEGKEPLVERFDITEDEWLEVQKTFARTMDIHGERLYRAEIYQVVNGKCPNGKYLYLDIHHVLSDGFSLMALSRDISAAYNGQPLTPETLDGAAVAQEEAAQRADEKRMADARDWYAKTFSDAAETDSLPIPQAQWISLNTQQGSARSTLNIKQPQSIYRYYPLTITKKEVQTIRERLDAKESTVMQTAWALLLAAYSAEEKASYCTVFYGRGDRRTRNAVTMMVHTLPVFMQWTSQSSALRLKELMAMFDEQQLQTRQYMYYAYPDAVQDFGLNNQVMFVYQGTDR